jgi:hypothetical protein
MKKGSIVFFLKRVAAMCAVLLGSYGFLRGISEIGIYFTHERFIAILACSATVMVVGGIIGRDFWRKGALPMLTVWGGLSVTILLAVLYSNLTLLLLTLYLGTLAGVAIALLTAVFLWRWHSVKLLLPLHLQFLTTLSFIIAECYFGIAIT